MQKYVYRLRQYYTLARQAVQSGQDGILTPHEVRESILEAALVTGAMRDILANPCHNPMLLDIWRFLCQSVLLPIEQITRDRHNQLVSLKTDKDRVEWYNAHGFTRAEAKCMVQGSTLDEARQRYGGIWTANHTEFPTALSASHARKLFVYWFGIEPREVKLVQ